MAKQSVLRQYTFDEVVRDQLVVVGGGVYDLKCFNQHHRGGPILAHLEGRDITLMLANAHSKNPVMRKELSKHLVGFINESTLPELDQDLRKLTTDIKRRGLFKQTKRQTTWDVVRIATLCAVSAIALPVDPLVFVVLSTIAYVDLFMWTHDLGHDSVFHKEILTRNLIDVAIIIFVGFPISSYHYITHRIHHGFPNVIGVDTALDTGPIIWDERQKKRSNWFLRIIQPVTWLALAPLFAFSTMAFSTLLVVLRRQYLLILLVMARWMIVYMFFSESLALLILPTLISGLLVAIISSLNHFAAPKSIELHPTFAETVFRNTYNISARGRFWTWIFHGLNFHIEHHLWANLPRTHLEKVAPEVEALAKKHGLPYHTYSPSNLLVRFFKILARPLKGPSPP